MTDLASLRARECFQLSTRGMIEIMSHEGICLEPYLDSVGVWTIGIGQTKSDDIDARTVGKLTASGRG